MVESKKKSYKFDGSKRKKLHKNTENSGFGFVVL